MERLHIAILAAGVVIGGGIAVAGQFIAGASIFIILAIIAMSLHIMNDAKNTPAIDCHLSADAKSVVVKNTGSGPAHHLHVALVPMNVEYDIENLGVEEEHAYGLPAMIEEIKAVVTYKNSEEKTFGATYKLSALDEDDPLKPAFPLFAWK